MRALEVPDSKDSGAIHNVKVKEDYENKFM